jgi:hypothetical protein
MPAPGQERRDVRSVDQRRFGDHPLELRTAELLEDVQLPDGRTIGLQAREIAVFREHVQPIAVHRRRAARTRAHIRPHSRFDRTDRLRPHFLAVRAIEGDDHAVRASRPLQEHPIAGNRH